MNVVVVCIVVYRRQERVVVPDGQVLEHLEACTQVQPEAMSLFLFGLVERNFSSPHYVDVLCFLINEGIAWHSFSIEFEVAMNRYIVP